MRETAWVLNVSIGTLSEWNKSFDDKMKPFIVPDNRGKASKVTVEIVRRIIEKAKRMKECGGKIRAKQFARSLMEEDEIVLSAKTVKEILIANDLAAVHVRKKRPKFYQNLCQRIPNGLLSLDGSEFTVWLGNISYKFNVELAVDVGSFSHTAFSVADTETACEVIKVLESHRKKWGNPVGILCDSGSANLSEDVKIYIKDQGIELVPAGPGNPKGNGTDEGAFSLVKKVFGTIRMDMSSPKALAKSVLEALVSVYVYMRNRLSLHGKNVLPIEQMRKPVSDDERIFERNRLKDHKKSKETGEDDQLKLDRLHWVIRHYGLNVESPSLKRAEYSIKAYEHEAIAETERAFLKAISRKADRRSLPYFFGILKNIQQQRDDETKKQYCRERYDYQMMLKMQREQDNEQEPVTIDHIMNMLEKAVTQKIRFVKNLATRRAREWTQELMQSYKYIGSLKKKLSDVLGRLNHLNLEQKQKAWELIEQFLNPKTSEECVTPNS